MKEILVRLAREDDFKAIEEMSKGVYSGHDYFLCVFNEWLHSPQRLIFVAELGGRVVGLRAVNIVDQGKTFISQGLRIHPDFRGQGLSSRLISSVHEYIRLHHPSVKRERFTTKSDNIERLAIQKKHGDRAVLDQDILAFYVNQGEISPEVMNKVSSEASIKLHPYNKNQVSEVLFSEGVSNILFQESCLIIDWEPFEALRSNIDYIFQDRDYQFADRSAADVSRGELPKSFSHGRISPRTDCVHWVTTIYTDDPILYRAHVLQQLKCALEQVHGSFIFSPFHVPSLSNEGRQILKEDLQLRPVEFFTFGLRLFEKEFK
ncbi:histidine N-acetyltransferase-like [Actinia tenebrosa]|uniref:Histidine N-acetyltransferase-like n=1 Tax=Actinia tenebrosa TaxID=6105 RepID=A0A6P8HJT2_ACTTE|nr:histidine N-acetyltransferase-like [Actinia tenebrosa]